MQHTKPRYTLAEGLKLLSLSRSKGYLRIAEGSLVPVYDGGKPFLTDAEIDRYAAQSHGPVEYGAKRLNTAVSGLPPAAMGGRIIARGEMTHDSGERIAPELLARYGRRRGSTRPK